MNELTSALRIANTAIRTVRVIEMLKKVVFLAAAILCGVLFIKFGFRKRL